MFYKFFDCVASAQIKVFRNNIKLVVLVKLLYDKKKIKKVIKYYLIKKRTI